MKKRIKKRMRITAEKVEQAHEYMRMWIDQENWTDLNVALDHEGDTIYAAHLLVSAGAINSRAIKKFGAEFHDETAYESELIVEELARRFRKGTDRQQYNHVKQTFKNCFIASCNECNRVSFLADGDEELYEKVKTECWECGSENIKTRRGIQ